VYVSPRRHDDGTLDLVVTEAAVTPAVPDAEAPAVSAPTLRELADRFDQLEDVARATFTQATLGAGERAAPKVRTRRELSEGFLRDVVRRHARHRDQGRAPTAALAREEGVSTGTVKHWLRRARELGIEEAS
jgi:hypothetical protein